MKNADAECKQASKESPSHPESQRERMRDSRHDDDIQKKGASPLSAKPLLLHSIVVYPESS